MTKHQKQHNGMSYLHDTPATLYTLYLPLRYNDGSVVSSHLIDQIQHDLLHYADGLTQLPPAMGLWKPSQDQLVRDLVMPIYVMVPGGPESELWFAHKLEQLAAMLDQHHIFCVAQSVQPVERSLILPSTNRASLKNVEEGDRNGSASVQCLDELTPREREVLALLVDGKQDSEIAAELVISVDTLGNHLHHIYEKLDVSGRYAAIVFAICMGFLPKIERIPHRRQERTTLDSRV